MRCRWIYQQHNSTALLRKQALSLWHSTGLDTLLLLLACALEISSALRQQIPSPTPATRLPVRLLLPFASACLLYLLCCLCFLHFALPSLHPYPSHSQIQPIHPSHTSYRIRKLTSKRRGATITTHHGCSRRRRPPASHSRLRPRKAARGRIARHHGRQGEPRLCAASTSRCSLLPQPGKPASQILRHILTTKLSVLRSLAWLQSVTAT